MAKKGRKKRHHHDREVAPVAVLPAEASTPVVGEGAAEELQPPSLEPQPGPGPEPPRRPYSEPGPEPRIEPSQLATRLNSVAIHLLRRLQREDAALGLTAARLSALSVLVFGGPRTLGGLAKAEGVTPPTMTRLVSAMEADGLVERKTSPTDARSIVLRATQEGERILLRGREQRVVALASWLDALTDDDLATLERSAALLETVLRDQRPRDDT